MGSYDRAITVFSPDGQLFQVQYANEAVKQGICALGVRGADCCVLASEKKAIAKLQDARTSRKIFKLDKNLSMAFAGLAADARVLANKTRIECQSYKLNYEDQATCEYVARFIARTQQKYTHRGGARPFGISTILAGFNTDGAPELYQTDPGGTFFGYKAVAVGKSFKTPQDFLEKKWEEGMDELATVKLAVRALLEICEANVENIEICIVKKDGERFMTNEELEPIVKELDDTAERLKKLQKED